MKITSPRRSLDIVVAAMLVLFLAPLVVRAATYPSDSGVINVKDYGAKGDGITDDTAAINAAINASTPSATTGIYWGQAKVVYFPSGTYMISNQLIKNNGSGSPTYGMVLIGQSMNTTTIKLANAAPGFNDPSSPKGMILPTSDANDGFSPSPGNGNAAYQNTIQDLTIDIGTGNPGAIGIDYLCNNLGAIRNVTVNAPSGTAGVTGIAMTRQFMGPALLENVSVNGFPVGLDVGNLQYSVTLDNVTLNNQTVAGLRNSQNQITANNLRTITAGPAIVNTTADGEIVFSGAVLNRGKGYSGSLISNLGTLVFRNANRVDDYQAFTGSNLPGNVVNGMLSPSGFVNGASGSYNTNIPIVDPPLAIQQPVLRWVSVASYGAQPSAEFTDVNDNVPNAVDASAGIQAAMNSGAATIYFPHGVYYIANPITVPATVQHIVGFDSSLHPTINEPWRSEGMFRILANVQTPLVIEQLRFDNSNDGNQLGLEQSSNRTVVVRDVFFAGTGATDRSTSGGPLFYEDVSAAGSQVNLDGSANFEARQFDFENCGTCMTFSGTHAVILGFKEEGKVVEVAATNGSKVDVLGGLAYMVTTPEDPTVPLFSTDGSSLTASFNEAVIENCCRYVNYLSETINGNMYTTPASNYPSRSDTGHVVGMLRSGPDIVTPSSEEVAAGSTIAIPGVRVIDAFAPNNPGTMALNVGVSAGTVAMTNGSGNPVPGSGTNSIQFDGTFAQVNAALATLDYTANRSAAGMQTLSLNVYDQVGANITQRTYIVIQGQPPRHPQGSKH